MTKGKKFDPKEFITKTEHYLDVVRINFYLDKEYVQSLLDKIIDENDLKENCRSYSFDDTANFKSSKKEAFKKLRRYKFKSQMTIVAPNAEILDSLKKLHELFVEDKQNSSRIENDTLYKISYIEVAKDMIVKNMSNAQSLSKDLYKDVNMRWMTKKDKTVYEDLEDHEDLGKINTEKSCPGGETYYTGGNSLYHAGYARESKIASEPCCHGEFRMGGAANIKKRTGVSDFKELSDLNLEDFYNEIEKKYFCKYSISFLHLGKWLTGLESKSKLNAAEYRDCILQAGNFCVLEKIKNYSDLLDFFKEEIKDNESPLKEKCSKANLSKFRHSEHKIENESKWTKKSWGFKPTRLSKKSWKFQPKGLSKKTTQKKKDRKIPLQRSIDI